MNLKQLRTETLQLHPTLFVKSLTVHRSGIGRGGEERKAIFHCKCCGTEFTRTPCWIRHRKRPCPTCMIRHTDRKSDEKFQKQLSHIWRGRIQSLEPYVSANIRIKFRCPNGHVFRQIPRYVLRKPATYGCIECAKERCRKRSVYTDASYRGRIESHYSDVAVVGKYVAWRTPILHRCIRGHEFCATPKRMLTKISQGALKGCEVCKPPGNYSLASQRVIEKIGRTTRLQFKRGTKGGEFKSLEGWKFDGYNKRFNIVLEYHGDYFHGMKNGVVSDINRYQSTLRRDEAIRKAGYNLIVVWSWDYSADPAKCISRVIRKIDAIRDQTRRRSRRRTRVPTPSSKRKIRRHVL